MRPAPLLEWVPPAPQFSTPDMHRREDMQTSIDAAERVARGRKPLQEAIHAILVSRGPMTAGDLERLECFSHFGPSTVRKRVSELKAEGRVEATDKRRDGMTVWAAAERLERAG